MENLFGLKSMVSECVIYQPTGHGRGAFVDVGDVASVAATCLMAPGHEGKTYEITGPEALSYADIAAVFERVLDHPVHFRECTFEQARQGMIDAGLPTWLADAINELSQGLKEGHFDKVTNVVREVTGHTPRSLEQFISDNIAAFR
jgi:uncharacterized protein YbjT (DUF2867 family)